MLAAPIGLTCSRCRPVDAGCWPRRPPFHQPGVATRRRRPPISDLAGDAGKQLDAVLLARALEHDAPGYCAASNSRQGRDRNPSVSTNAGIGS